jgi:hypothetical protein
MTAMNQENGFAFYSPSGSFLGIIAEMWAGRRGLAISDFRKSTGED